jgi:ABC-type dipeptide/oligopeptide/nickel transport system permease component
VDAAAPWSGSGRPGTRGAPRRLVGPWWLAVLSSLAWLVLAAIVLRLGSATAALVLLAAVFLLSVSDEFLSRARCGLSPQRKLAGHAQAAALALLLTVLLASLHQMTKQGCHRRNRP